MALLFIAASGLAKQPLENWYSRSPSLTSENFKSVTYGNERFVAVGAKGTIVMSMNGIDWTQAVSPTASNLNSVTFGANRFVVGGDHGMLLSSEDGVDWTSSRLDLVQDVTAVGFGIGTNFPSGQFVALATISGANTIKLVSASGTDWTILSNQTAEALYPGRYDGIAYGKDCFVAWGRTELTASRSVFSRSGGTNWSFSYGTADGPMSYGQGIFVSGLLFTGPPTGAAFIANQSPDGVWWPAFNYSGSFPPSGLCFGNGQFVAVGDRGYTANSSDGTNWTVHPAGTDATLRSVTFGTGLFAAVGDTGVILTSEDGSNWIQRSTGTMRDLIAVAADDTGFVAAGNAGSIAWSSNGTDWASLKVVASNFLAVVKANGNYVFSGQNGTILSGDSLTNLAIRASGTHESLSGATFGNGTYILVGGSGTILTSSDSISWAPRSSGITSYIVDIAFGGGRFVAVADRVLTSTNGLAWEAQSTLQNMPFVDVAYGNGRFVASFSSPRPQGNGVIVSTDGVNWKIIDTVPSAPVGIAFGNGFFVVPAPAYGSGCFFVSQDGERWESVTTPGITPGGVDLAYSNGSFVSVGRFGRIFQSAEIVRLNMVHDGSAATLRIEGPANRSYRVEASETPEDTNCWSQMSVLSAAPYEWVDSLGSSRRRFYRGILLP